MTRFQLSTPQYCYYIIHYTCTEDEISSYITEVSNWNAANNSCVQCLLFIKLRIRHTNARDNSSVDRHLLNQSRFRNPWHWLKTVFIVSYSTNRGSGEPIVSLVLVLHGKPQTASIPIKLTIWTISHFQTERKWSHHVADNIFKYIVLKYCACIMVGIPLNFVIFGSINDKPEVVRTMAWHRTSSKPLSASNTLVTLKWNPSSWFAGGLRRGEDGACCPSNDLTLPLTSLSITCCRVSLHI